MYSLIRYDLNDQTQFIQKHLIQKNHKVQLSTNQILKNKIEKKTFDYTKGSKTKNKNKRKIIKIEIKNKLYFLLNDKIEKKNQFQQKDKKNYQKNENKN